MKEKSGEYKKGLWSEEEDRILMDYVRKHGKGKWNRIPKLSGLNRCGKSCRLRWLNYLNPGVKRGGFSDQEDDLIIRLHNLLGNRWSLIAGRVPGRTDNQVKNYWNTHLSKKLGIKNKTTASSSQSHHPSPKSRDDAASGGTGSQDMDSWFWQCYNNNDLLFNLHTPTTVNVMELLDQDMSLDFVSHAL